MHASQLICSLLLLLSLAGQGFAAAFPYREKYPEVNVIEMAALKSGYDRGDFLLVDLRTPTEFEIIHIREAVNLTYPDLRFTEKMQAMVKANPGKKIALYDNGIDCIKAYKGGEDALYAMLPDVYVFDAGIDAWAKAYPAEVLLFGEKIDDPGKQLIGEEQFAKKALDFAAFSEEAADPAAIVIDARDPAQRVEPLPGIANDRDIPVDKLVGNIISKGHMKDKRLLIFDQVGRQARWLMLCLVRNGYDNYYFLAGGATSVLKRQEYRSAALR